MGCRRRADPCALVRIQLRDGVLVTGPGPGRGAWLCADRRQCLEQALSTGAFERALRSPIDPAALASLASRLSGTGPRPVADL